MTTTERFEQAFWLGMVDDAEKTLERIHSIRQELRDSIAADKILSRFYPSSGSTLTKVNEDFVAMIDRLLVEYDRLDEVPF